MLPSEWMPKWKRNQIFKAIQDAGLDPKDFDFKDGDAEVRIKHKWSDSYFSIGGNSLHYVGTSVVGDAPPWCHTMHIHGLR